MCWPYYHRFSLWTGALRVCWPSCLWLFLPKSSSRMDGKLSLDASEDSGVHDLHSTSPDVVRRLANLWLDSGKRSRANVVRPLYPSASHSEGVPHAGTQCLRIGARLDERVWGLLPEHLVDCILAWLPLDAFFRFRCVCRRWNSLMHSKPYLDSLCRVPSQGLYILMFTGFSQHQVGAAYNLGSNTWHGIPFANFLSYPSAGPVNVLATSGGLMCLQGMGTQLHTLFVSNPMRREQRKLPPMLYMRSPYVLGMVMQRDKKAYKIVVAQDGDFVTSQVYNSETNFWSMTGTLHRRSALVCGGAFLNGFLYCTTYGPHGIVAFDLEAGSWHDTEIPLPPSLTTCDLLERRGSLIMVGGIEKFGMLESVRVWELDLVERTCLELRRMPEEYFKMLFLSAAFHFLCVGKDDVICFHETHSRNTLMYDFVKDLWQWLPSCTIQNMESNGLLGVAFEPRLDSLV